MSQQCCSAAMQRKSLVRFVIGRKGRNKQRCTCNVLSGTFLGVLRATTTWNFLPSDSLSRTSTMIARTAKSSSRCNRRRFWSMSLIDHFHINHNAACLHQKFYISIVFELSWDDYSPLEKLQTMVKTIFLGGEGGTTCIMVYVKMANSWTEQNILHCFVFASLTASLDKYLIRLIFSSLWHRS